MGTGRRRMEGTKERRSFSPESYRLPMLVTHRYVYQNLDSCYLCPRCQISLEREFASYCDRCGQCLNWSKYREAALVFVKARSHRVKKVLLRQKGRDRYAG